jgi:hypothetical protein
MDPQGSLKPMLAGLLLALIEIIHPLCDHDKGAVWTTYPFDKIKPHALGSL